MDVELNLQTGSVNPYMKPNSKLKNKNSGSNQTKIVISIPQEHKMQTIMNFFFLQEHFCKKNNTKVL